MTAEGISSLSNEEILSTSSYGVWTNSENPIQSLKSFPHPNGSSLSHKYTLTELQEDCIGSIQYSTLPTTLISLAYNRTHMKSNCNHPKGITFFTITTQHPPQSSPSPKLIQPNHEAEETTSMPHDSPLYDVHSYGSAKGSVQQHDLTEEEVHEKPSDETEVLVQEETPTRNYWKHGSWRSKDKGKAIMEEPATPKKVKKRTQVQLSMDEELARKMEKEERIRFNAEQEARACRRKEEN
ncbi:hypothetical protein Tco_1109812 [Tanacetum coccineum]|uniref:Uncharacterized protein n=1 Tax=Tanacetum coccineum TaxID=301880 RepID=A0ABQ5E8V0_9ASTR